MLSTSNPSAPRERRAVSCSHRQKNTFGGLFAATLLCLLTFSSAGWAQFNYNVYHGNWSELPDFTSLTPVLTGTTNAIDVSVSNRTDDFGLVFTNQLTVSVAGNYEFLTTSDDGSKLYIENTVVVDNDGLHAPVTETGQIFLNPGTYSLRVEFFERGGGEVINVQYRVAGGSFEPIPPDGQLNGVVPGVADVGTWGPVISWPHIAISAANLPDGRVLTWSSTETNAFPSNREFTHSAVFNPADNSFIDTSSNFHDMFCAGVSMLETGEVVASGGNPDDSRTSMFDPGGLTWEPLAEMFDRRWYASNITLPNNDVFSTFGKSAGNRSEKYDADANQWTRTPNASMQTLLDEHNAIGGMEWFPLLAVQPNGRVFHGGPTLTLHSFDPVAGSANEVLGQATGNRARKWGNIATYDAGKVLLIGGSEPRNNVANRVTASNVYRVDLNGPTPVITQGGSMNFGRALSNTVVLPNGEVLVVGGNTNGLNFNDATSVFPAEIYNPDSDSWRVVDSIDIPRNYHSTALLLKDARVLSAGGGACGNCAENHLDGQIFTPPYLFNSDGSPATRPTLSGVDATAGAGNTIIVSASADTQRFTMVRLSATTHHQNTDQRFLPIASVDNGDGTFSLTFDANPNVLIQGYYWIFAVNANDTPSVGETIQILRELAGETDRDGDSVPDSEDEFPDDPNESVDTDGDGVGDNGDAFPNDPTETLDTDDDDIGDNSDPTPYGSGHITRYVRLTALSEVNGNPWASAAEVNLLGTDGLPLDRSGWIATASSAETVAEDGDPANALDGDVNTIWITEYSTGNPIHPYYLYIDTGAGNAVTGLRYLPQNASDNGTIRNFEIHISEDGVNWGDPLLVGEFTEPAMDTAILPVNPDFDIAPLPQAPRNSTTILVENSTGVDRIWNVNPDNDRVSVSSAAGVLIQEIPVGDKPWALAKSPASNQILVTNKDDATISVIDTDTLNVVQTIALPFHSQPHGIVFNSLGSDYYVVLEATGQVERRNAATHAVIATVQLSGVPRHLAITYDDSRLLVSNFITPPAPGESTAVVDLVNAGAEVFAVDPNSMTLNNTIALAHDDRGLSESSGPGLPNYLNAPVISFDNSYAYVPSKKDNIGSGVLRANPGMTFESTVRANGSRIVLGSETEDPLFRVDFDNASLATGAAFSSDSRYLLTALETSRELSIYDTVNNFELMRLPTGRAPQGVALSSDGSIAYVHNFMDRSISRFDLTEMLGTNLPISNVLSTVSVVTVESLSATVLNGKQLFYDAADNRMSRDNYMSCASCHNDGDSDGRSWDLTGLGEGLRNTISLKGTGAVHGKLHWSQNFDEVQDFEGQIRELSAGTGLMTDLDFNSGTRSEPLGDPKAGLSSDLDDLAAYVESLTDFPSSPYRNSDGSLTVAGENGREIFRTENCASCHTGTKFSDSDLDILHDIGTLKPSSGQRLGDVLTGIDTPTLRGVLYSSPYLHDGSALTLADAVSAHTAVSLAGSDLANLVSYLQQIDDNEVSAPQNTAPSITDPGSQSTKVGVAVNFGIVASDVDGDTLSYSAIGLPTGLDINNISGLIGGTPDTVDNYNVTVTVSDGLDSSNSNFSWDVTQNTVPTITNPGDQSGETGTTVNVPITASDADGDALTYSATGLPAGLSISTSSGVITGTPTTASVNNVTATVSDGENSASTSFSWTLTTGDSEVFTAFDAATTVPAVPAASDSTAFELGVRFRTASNGYVTGVRFYKGAGNTGQHVGNLWTESGTLLASAIFTGETATGWQQVNFATPVPVTADTVYVASYSAPNGHYSFDTGYFGGSGVNAGPLYLLQDGEDGGGNGVFSFGAASAFPNNSYAATNYYVDVVFSDDAGPLVAVPNIVNTPQASAEAALTSAGLTIGTVSRAYDGTVPLGSVISQDPAGGSQVPDGSAVALIISDGPVPPDGTPPTVPTGLSATVNGSYQVDLSWAASTDNETGVGGYRVYVDGTDSGVTTATTFSVTGLAANTSYSFTVAAFDNAAPANTSAQSAAVSATTDPDGLACPCTTWDDTTVPAVPAASDSTAFELGVRFRAASNGYVTGVRFYKGAGNTGQHVGNLWTESGTLLASAIFTGETATGWQQVDFATPVPVTADTVYVASYSAPNGHYSFDTGYFGGSGVNVGPLYLLQDGEDGGGNGVFSFGAASAFPNNSYAATNYYVDVVFSDDAGPLVAVPNIVNTPQASAEAALTSAGLTIGTVSRAYNGTVPLGSVISQDPAGGSQVPDGSAVALIISDGPVPPDGTPPTVPTGLSATVNGSYQVDLSWAASTDNETGVGGYRVYVDGTDSGVTTATTFSVTGLAANTSYSFTVAAFDNAAPANTSAQSAAVSATTDPDGLACPCTTWDDTTVPAVPAASDSTAFELGVRFRAASNGYVTGVRFYKGAGNTGQHVGNLWTESGTLLASAIFTGETATGWQQVDFAAPVPVTANTVYVASYSAPNGGYSFDIGYFATSGVNSGPLYLLQDGEDGGGNGVFSFGAASAFPGDSYGASNYYVDVVFATE